MVYEGRGSTVNHPPLFSLRPGRRKGGTRTVRREGQSAVHRPIGPPTIRVVRVDGWSSGQVDGCAGCSWFKGGPGVARPKRGVSRLNLRRTVPCRAVLYGQSISRPRRYRRRRIASCLPSPPPARGSAQTRLRRQQPAAEKLGERVKRAQGVCEYFP